MTTKTNPHGLPDQPMSVLLQIILEGMAIHENSYNNGAYDVTRDEATSEAAKKILGDAAENALTGFFCHLASHWSNDVQTVAAYYGMELLRKEGLGLFVSYDVPAAPSFEHYWDDHQWIAPRDEEETDVAR